MRDNIDELMNKTFHKGDKPNASLNENIMKMAYENQNTSGVEFKRNKRAFASATARMAKVAAVAAAVLVVGSGAAYAAGNYFGIDYFSRKSGSELSDSAKNIIDKNPDTIVADENKTNNLLDYKVKEVLCDSNFVLATVDISVKKSDKYLLYTSPYDVDSPVSALSIGTDSNKTIREYCDENRLIPMLVNLDFDKNTSDNIARKVIMDCKQQGAENITVLLGAKRLNDSKKFDISIQPEVLYDMSGANEKMYKDAEIQVRVEDKSITKNMEYEITDKSKASLMENGMEITNAEIKHTEVGNYLSVTYKPETDSRATAEEFIQLCDKNGTLAGLNIVGEGVCKKNDDGSYTSTGCYVNDELSDTIYLTVGKSKKIIEMNRVK